MDENHQCVSGTKSSLFFQNFFVFRYYKMIEETSQGENFADTVQILGQSTNLKEGLKLAKNLQKGTYTLKFDYCPDTNYDPEMSSFSVYLNGLEVAKIRPPKKGIRTQQVTVAGEAGENFLEFVQMKPDLAVVIYNVFLERKQVEPKEVDAVSAGGVVTMSSVWDPNHNMYQLDREGLNIGAWCLVLKEQQNWQLDPSRHREHEVNFLITADSGTQSAFRGVTAPTTYRE